MPWLAYADALLHREALLWRVGGGVAPREAAGWFVTEIGRQPYLIYGVMTAAQALTPSLQGWMALVTLIGYAAIYAVVFTAGIHYLRKVINHGITEVPAHGADAGRPKRPLSAAELERTGLAPSFFKA